MKFKFENRILLQYNIVYDCNIIRVDVFGGSLKDNIKIRWRDFEDINKVKVFLGNWHKFAGTIREDMLFEMSEIVQKVVNFIKNKSPHEINKYTIQHQDGYKILPLGAIILQGKGLI